MKRGFTILELLVASLLLGMLMTILTMLFNQSSVSWRTGIASVADLDDVRDNIAEVRDEADNAYIWANELHRIIGLWDEQGNLRQRAWDVGPENKRDNNALLLQNRASYLKNDNVGLDKLSVVSVGSGGSGGSLKTYTVNVKSAGPDREFNTYDDIWSYPDEVN